MHYLLSTSVVAYSLIWEDKTQELNDPLLEELEASPAFQRLKGVDQSGPITYYGNEYHFNEHGINGPMPSFSRYDHSLAVWNLVKKAGCNLATQVAAFLHDASHTAFSHLGDHLLHALGKNESTQNCYQDDVHLDYLRHYKIDEILAKHGLNIEDMDPTKHPLLKAPKGSLGADKIQYLIHTGVIMNILSKETSKEMIDNVVYDQQANEWYFTNHELARHFGRVSDKLTTGIYTAPDNYVFYQYLQKPVYLKLKLALFLWKTFNMVKIVLF